MRRNRRGARRRRDLVCRECGYRREVTVRDVLTETDVADILQRTFAPFAVSEYLTLGTRTWPERAIATLSPRKVANRVDRIERAVRTLEAVEDVLKDNLRMWEIPADEDVDDAHL